MTWKLYLDDVRDPDEQGWTVIRSSIMAVVTIVKRKEIPEFMSLDHDLGEDDNTMRFLKELHHIWEDWGSEPDLIPGYVVHSANPVGAKNIISFMESWKKSVALEA
jgi:hypothetical protein